MSTGHEPSSTFSTAIDNVFRPLVRFLIRHQITFPYLSQRLKQIYVEVALSDFPVEGKRMTDSRLSLLTGVHRKDVRRLKTADAAKTAPQKAASLGAQVVATWISTPPFADKAGNALPLFRLATDGEPSFETLVETVSKQDLRARSLLDEWRRLGVIDLDKNDKVTLIHDAFIPASGFDEKAFFFGRGVGDHIAASSDNLTSESPPHFDRGVYYNNLSQASIDELEKMAREEANSLIKRVNQRAKALQQHDATAKGEKRRFHFGAFFYQQPQEKNSDDKS